MPTNLLVNEIYGPILQGEGPSLGTPAAFLRVAACNLSCVWCDTAYTWDWQRYNKEDEVHPMDTKTVVEKVRAVLPPGPNPLLIISGGEPMLQQPRIVEVMNALPSNTRFEIETAGTIAPTKELLDTNVMFNVSPKLEHSGNAKAKRYKPNAINALMASGRVQGWKFVAQAPADLDEVSQLVAMHNLSPVFIMPEGVTPQEVTKHTLDLADGVIQAGWRLTPRLHVYMHGDARAV